MPTLGKLRLAAPFFQAGLAGYSDAAMRLVARRHGAPYAVTEAMLDLFLLNGGKGLTAAELDSRDHPIAGQLMGSHPADMAKAATVLVKLGYDVIDVNLACPVKKIKKRSRGGHLLSVPDEAIAMLDAVRQAVPGEVPVTVKLRRGSDDSVEAEANFHRIFTAAVELGYAGACVHGRTVEQKYVGPSHWPFLTRLVAEYRGVAPRLVRAEGRKPSDDGEQRPTTANWCPSVTTHDASDMDVGTCTFDRGLTPLGSDAERFHIAGSGDIWTAADIFRMIDETGVDAVSVARGCIGNPWIFEQAHALSRGDLAGGSRPPTLAQQRAVLLEHFELSASLHGEKQASMMMRKFGIKFSRHHPQSENVAKAFIAVRSLEDWRAVLREFYEGLGDDARGMVTSSWPSVSSPGVVSSWASEGCEGSQD